MDYFDEINSFEYLYLTEVKEPRDNSLLITIKEATISGKEEDIVISGIDLGTGKRITEGGPGRTYEIYFKSYAGYNVLNESFAIFQGSDDRVGRLYCIYSKSIYLDFMRETTFAESIYNQELKHYAFNCLNHTIDIATIEKPVIKLL